LGLKIGLYFFAVNISERLNDVLHPESIRTNSIISGGLFNTFRWVQLKRPHISKGKTIKRKQE